jgi:3-oxoacyl-[acyl-carrier protein] reductase
MVHAEGGKAEAVVCDVSKEKEVENLVRSAVRRFGKIDILVNDAAVMPNQKSHLVDLSIQDWDSVFNINLRGSFLCIKSVLPLMIENKKGNIINITSFLAVYAPQGRIAYGASKAALDRLTFGLAEEVRKYNIAVNALTPAGLADSPGARVAYGTPDSWVKAEDVAKAAVWLCKQDAKSFTGRAIAVTASTGSTLFEYGRMSGDKRWIRLD